MSRGKDMISRLFGPATSTIAALTAFLSLTASVALADGPEYTYIGISYEWTDVKYGSSPAEDPDFNEGSLEGENIEASIGFLDMFHVRGQAFGYLDGTCKNCNTNPDGSQFDADVEGFKVGAGVNLGLDMIGLSEDVDFVLRGNYVDIDYSNLNFNSPSSVSDDGWSVETMIAGRISERADVFVGWEYTDLSNAGNRDITLGLNYIVWEGLSLVARGIIFDSESGFELGVRWGFGDLFSSEE